MASLLSVGSHFLKLLRSASRRSVLCIYMTAFTQNLAFLGRVLRPDLAPYQEGDSPAIRMSPFLFF